LVIVGARDKNTFEACRKMVQGDVRHWNFATTWEGIPSDLSLSPTLIRDSMCKHFKSQSRCVDFHLEFSNRPLNNRRRSCETSFARSDSRPGGPLAAPPDSSIRPGKHRLISGCFGGETGHSRRFDGVQMTSGLPSRADRSGSRWHVSKVLETLLASRRLAPNLVEQVCVTSSPINPASFPVLKMVLQYFLSRSSATTRIINRAEQEIRRQRAKDQIL